MKDYEKIAWYAGILYGPVSIEYSTDKDIMFIRTPWDYFKIYLMDKERFGYYTVMHENKEYSKGGWHRQKRCRHLHFAVFLCVIHGFYKENEIPSDGEDFKYFIQDAARAWKYDENNKEDII